LSENYPTRGDLLEQADGQIESYMKNDKIRETSNGFEEK